MPLTQTQIEQELANDIKCDACEYSDKCSGWRHSARCYINERPSDHVQLAVGFRFAVKGNKTLKVGEQRICGLQAFFTLDPKQIKLSYPKLSQRLITAIRCAYDAECGYNVTLDDINGKTLTIRHFVSRMLIPKTEPVNISNNELRNILTTQRRVFDIAENKSLHPFFIGNSNAVI